MWCTSLPSYIIAAGLSHVVHTKQFLGGYLTTIHLVSSQLQVYTFMSSLFLTQCLAKPSSLTTIPGWEEWNDTRAGRVTTNPGTRRGGKMPGMGRLQSRNHTAYKDGTKVSKLRRGRWSIRAVKTGGSGHSYLGKGPAPEICLCPIRNCNILGLVLHCFELCH